MEYDNPYFKTYSGQNWLILIYLINKKKGLNILLYAKNINLMTLYNDILCFSPTFELKYMDQGLTLSKVLDVNDLQLDVTLHQPVPNDVDPLWQLGDALTMRMLFDVERVETIFKLNVVTMYQFNAVHHNKTFLMQTINKATVNNLKDTRETKESPLSLIQKILSDAKYPHDDFYNDTNQRISFITSQTMTVQDSIDYLLRRAISPYDPPTYFVHNLKTGNAMLINSKKYELRLDNPANYLNVYGNPDSKPSNTDLLNLATNITNFSFNNGILAERYLGNFIYRNFDHNNRSWNSTNYSYNSVNYIFNHEFETTGVYESLLPMKQSVNLKKISYDFPVHDELKMYLFMRELQLGLNSITFDTGGLLVRDAGQYVFLTCANESQIPRYEGYWFVYGCEHKWSGMNYTNQLVCYRTWAKPAIKNERNETKQTGA